MLIRYSSGILLLHRPAAQASVIDVGKEITMDSLTYFWYVIVNFSPLFKSGSSVVVVFV